MTAFGRTDIPMNVKDGELELRTAPLDDTTTVAWVVAPAGTDLRPALAGLPGDLCPCPHMGYMLKGRLVMHTEEGRQTYEAGQGFSWSAGHAPEVLEDSEYIEFSPTREFEPVLRHLKGES